MDRLFSKILETIEGAANKFSNAGLTPPQTIDAYLGQPESPEDFEFFTPAVFIDISADYANKIGYAHVYVAQRYGSDSENFADDRQSGLWYFRFLRILKNCLKGIKTPPVFGALKLHQENPLSAEKFHYHQVVFSFTLNDELDDTGKFIDVIIDDVEIKHEDGTLKERKPLKPKRE